jgi:hypothetical protein
MCVGRLPRFSSSISSCSASLRKRAAQGKQISLGEGLPQIRHSCFDPVFIAIA